MIFTKLSGLFFAVIFYHILSWNFGDIVQACGVFLEIYKFLS